MTRLDTAAEAAPATAAGPRGRRTRIALLWIAFGVIVLLGVLAVWAAGRAGQTGDHERSPEDSRPAGAMAVAQVLRAQGVELVVTHSFTETQAAMWQAEHTTLLVDDDWWVLTPEAYRALLSFADRFVLVQPTDEALDALAHEVRYGGFGGGTASAGCALLAAERAGTIVTDGDVYRAPATAERCFSDGADGYSLVHLANATREVYVLGASGLLRNDTVTREGDAALALGLLGATPRLVWYQPDVDDYSFEPSGSLASRQAAWYLPLVLLLLLVGVAAALWRGRRMGPVVVEDLPVEVRSSETMEGRARLYERGGARDHALHTLRAATLARLARILGLPRTASDEEIVAAVAAATGRDPAGLYGLLRTTGAADDRSFVRLSDDLLRLEQELARSIRPE